MAQVVYSNVENAGSDTRSLFNGKKFWLSTRVPMRKRFVDEVKSYGGEIVPLEKQADILIVNDKQKDVPANSISWQFLDKSIRNGALENEEDHRLGPAEMPPRPAGSSIVTAKSTRTPFTANDDKILLEWVAAKAENNRDAGNKMFQQLGEKYPHHPWQAWRHRYVKKYRGQLHVAKQSTQPIYVSSGDEQVKPTNTPKKLKVEFQVEASVPAQGNEQIPKASPQEQLETSTQPPPTQESHASAPDTASEPHGEGSHSQLEESQHGDTSEEFYAIQHAWTRIMESEGFEMHQEAIAAHLLASTEEILSHPDDHMEAAWRKFAQTHGKSSEYCKEYFRLKIRPFHAKHLERFRQEAETAAKESPEPDASARASSPQSPSFEPGSPELPTHVPSILSAPAPRTNGVKVGESPSPLKEPHSQSVHKRTRDPADDEWDEIPDDTPLDLPSITLSKRPRLDTSPRYERELDLASSDEAVSAVRLGSLYPVLPPNSDEEEERGSAPGSGEFVHPHSKIGQNDSSDGEAEDGNSNDDSEYEEEEEDLEVAESEGVVEGEEHESGPALSQTLTEPELDTQGRVDAQIFADLRSCSTSSIVDGHISGEPMSSASIPKKKPSVEQSRKIVTETPKEPGDNNGEGSAKYEAHRSKKGQQLYPGEEIESSDEGDLPEIPRTQPQRLSGKGNRTFKPAAFRNDEESDAGSPELLLRTPTPPPRSLPMQNPRLSSPAQISSHRPVGSSADPEPEVSHHQESDPAVNALDEWIKTHLQNGASYKTVEKAIFSTCMDPELADKVLEQMSLRGKDSVPGNMEGVWTEGDDDCLQSQDPKMFGLVMTKHGEQSLNERWRFLRNLANEESQ